MARFVKPRLPPPQLDSESNTRPELDAKVRPGSRTRSYVLDRHYRDALDQPVRMLGGETPRAAVKTDSGRIKLVEWLKMMENRTARSADPNSPMANYSFGWLWTELGPQRTQAMNEVADELESSWRLWFCQRPRLNQQTLSLVTAARPAEAHDDSMSGAFRFRAPRKQGIARRQIFEIIEANATQACRTGILHHKELAGAFASMACPLRVQWLDDHQLRSTACLFRQSLALLLGKLRRHPMCPV